MLTERLLLKFAIMLVILLIFCAPISAKQNITYNYSHLGNPNDSKATPQAGWALMGGGTDQDEAFKWFIKQASNGDIVVLRASGTDAYNAYIESLGQVNSVQTIVFHARQASYDPLVLEKIRKAEGIFFAGGDQSKYYSYWSDTPVEKEVNAAIKRGAVIGGTSAGLAVQGENCFTAKIDSVTSSQVLDNPLTKSITIAPGMFNPGILKNVITDTHFANRNRMGRLLVFLYRLQNSGSCHSPIGLGVDEATALLIDKNGSARLVGKGNAYILKPAGLQINESLKPPFNYKRVEVLKVVPTDTFYFNKLRQASLKRYYLSIINGKVYSYGNDGSLY